MNVKYIIAHIVNDIRNNNLQEADHNVTHIMARVKYPKPVYMQAMLLKGCLKKAVDYGPKFKNKTIRPVLTAENNLMNTLKASEHKVTNNEQKG